MTGWKIEGDTGSPMSRFEFICRLLSEAMHVENSLGYDVYWLITSSMALASTTLNLLQGGETPSSGDRAALLEMLMQRTYDFPHANHDVACGPWPMSREMKSTGIVAGRILHYTYCIRPTLVLNQNGIEPDGLFLEFEGSNGGRAIPVSEDMVWSSLRKSLSVMERLYPISSSRYLPHLTKPDDLSTFLRWRLESHGRVPDDLLTDENAALILEAQSGTARQNRALMGELERELRNREAKTARREALSYAPAPEYGEARASGPRSLRRSLAERKRQSDD